MAFAINLEVSTAATQVAQLSQQVVDVVAPAADGLASQAGLPDMIVDIRLTDGYVTEIESQRRPDLPSFTTKRVGGDAVGRCRQATAIGEPYLVLIDASAFDESDSWLLSHVPQVIAHEVGHCLLGQCRLMYGSPSGYFDAPANAIEALGYTSLTACDEYMADRLGHMLLPPVGVEIENDGSIIAATDRIVLGTSRLTTALDELDAVIYPRLPQMVARYRMTGEGLTELVDELIRSVHESLVMYAHYKAAILALPAAGEIRAELDKVSTHPGTRLLLDPFWDAVADCLDMRFSTSPLTDFASQDQACLDAAMQGLELAWAGLGIRFELLADGAVYVHVPDPMSLA